MVRSGKILAGAMLAGALVIAAGLAPAHASPRSSALIDDGILELQRADWREALRKFLAASVADPKDAEAQFFQGVALNRLSLHEQALAQIERARAAGVKNPEMDFEYGWALLGAEKPADALASLRAYKAANPESGKTAELIGRAQLAEGNISAAESSFDEAVRLDPNLQTSVSFFRSIIANKRGDTDAGVEAYNSITSTAQNGPLSTTLRRQLDLLRAINPVARTERPKPWTVFGATSIGRNSNVIALSEDIAQPADITRKDSRYYDLLAGGTYRKLLDPTQFATVGAVLNRRNYRDIRGNDTDTINLFARYDRNINARTTASGTVSFSHIRVDGDKTQNIWAVSPQITHRINDKLQASVFYSVQKINSVSPSVTPAQLDRDSRLQNAGGDVMFRFPSLKSDLTIGGSVLQNSAVGSDYDYRAYRFQAKARTQLPYGVSGAIGIVRTSYEYKNLNSLAPTTPPGATGFGFKREDAITKISLDLSRPINEMFTAYVRASRTDASSNLAVFDYDQKDIQLGITARF